MNTTDKFYTDQEFEDNNISYNFCVYANKHNADTDTTAASVMAWSNNNLSSNEARVMLMAMASTAKIKYKNPVAVLWADTPDGRRDKLASCQA